MKKNLFSVIQMALLIGLLAISAQAQAHAPTPTAQLEAMKKLNFLVGEWRGDGWATVEQKREAAKQTETVQFKVGGVALLVEGLGRSTADNNRIVHNALAVLSYDVQKQSYRVSTYQASGVTIEAVATVGDNTLEWGFKTDRGTVRFTIKLTEKGEWNEVGDFSPDGKSWYKFMEMTLQKVK
jgi:hypothetical protein